MKQKKKKELPLLEEYSKLSNRIQKKIRAFTKWNKEKTLTWMKSKNANLGGMAPMHLIILGRGHKVEAFVDAMIEEGTSDT